MVVGSAVWLLPSVLEIFTFSKPGGGPAGIEKGLQSATLMVHQVQIVYRSCMCKQNKTGTRTIIRIISSRGSFRVRIVPYFLFLNFISPALARGRDLRNGKCVSNHTCQQRFLFENVRELQSRSQILTFKLIQNKLVKEEIYHNVGN